MVEVGDRIRDYEVVARLRSGGMATLFLGRRRGPGGFARPVAIKVIHPHLATDADFIQMFIDEAVLSARISHPNVVHVEDFGEEAGSYFLAMEYVDGCSLSQLIRALRNEGEGLSVEVATYLGIKIAAGLHGAHETLDEEGKPMEVVHRDVSPSNVLLSRDGHIKIIDFGIAKAQGRVQHTSTSSLKGKVRYMAPEQAYGKQVDRRTDVYCLGVVLWELLTMRPLFSGDNEFALLDVVRQPRAVPPSKYAPKVPPALDAAVMKALAPERSERPATAHEFRRMLVQAVPDALAVEHSALGDLVRKGQAFVPRTPSVTSLPAPPLENLWQGDQMHIEVEDPLPSPPASAGDSAGAETPSEALPWWRTRETILRAGVAAGALAGFLLVLALWPDSDSAPRPTASSPVELQPLELHQAPRQEPMPKLEEEVAVEEQPLEAEEAIEREPSTEASASASEAEAASRRAASRVARGGSASPRQRSRRSTFRARQRAAESPRAEPSPSPRDSQPKEGAGTEVDGILIADDDAPLEQRPTNRRDTERGPQDVGGIPIAEDFD